MISNYVIREDVITLGFIPLKNERLLIITIWTQLDEGIVMESSMSRN